jgi:hypothetical protein
MLVKISSFCTLHKSSVSTGFTEQIMPILRILCYNGSLVTKLYTLPTYNPSARTAYKIPLPIFVVQSLLWENICLRSRYSVTATVYLLIRGLCQAEGVIYRDIFSNGPTSYSIHNYCYAMAHGVSFRLPTSVAQAQSQIRSCENLGGQSGTGTGFLRVCRFPLHFLIPPTLPYLLTYLCTELRPS